MEELAQRANDASGGVKELPMDLPLAPLAT